MNEWVFRVRVWPRTLLAQYAEHVREVRRAMQQHKVLLRGEDAYWGLDERAWADVRIV